MSTRKTEHSIAADNSSQALRQQAEEKTSLDESSALKSLTLDDARRMLHELQVHQIELEMQNEELRNTQHELEASRKNYFDLYDLAPVGYLTLSEQGMIQQANLAAATMLGLTRRDMRKKPISSFFLQEDQDIYNRHSNIVLEADELQAWEMSMLRADGSLFWAKLRATPAHNDEYWITLIDITGRKQAEAERAAMTLQQKGVNLLLQSLLKPAPLETKLAGITDGIVGYFDADFCRIWMIRPGDLCEQVCIHAKVTEGPHVCRQRDRCLHLLASSGRYTHIDGKVHRRVPFGCYKIGRIASGEEHKFLTNDVENDPQIHDHEWAHNLGLVSFAGYQLRVPDGETIGVLALFSRHHILPSEDAMLNGLSSAVALTVQQAAAEDALRENTIFLNTLLNSLPLPVFYKDSNCRYIGFNKAFEEFIGKTRDQLLGKSVFDIAPRELVEVYHAKDLELLRDQVTQVYESQVKDMHGVIHDVVFHKATFMDSKGCILGLIGAISDITERKQAEDALCESESNYRTLADSGQALIWASNTDKLCDYFNKVWLDFTGRTLEQELGNGWAEGVHPDDFQHCLDIYIAAFDKRETFSMDYRIRRHDGEYCWIQNDGCPRYDMNGNFVGYIGYCLDITAHKIFEKNLQQQNAEIEQFIYTVSHDLRSPLVTIKTFLGYLEQDISASDSNRIAKDLGFVYSAADRMEALLNELLDMARVGRETVDHQTVTFQKLVGEALDAVAGQITTGKIDARVSAANPTLCGDRRRLPQIWQNLLENALKYMGDQALPIIEIGVEQQHGDTVFFVCDNGIGIAPAYHEKVFGIFEQLDRHSGGVGMGLTMVRRIVEFYGGKIWVESGGQGQGCCFRFTLPGSLYQE